MSSSSARAMLAEVERALAKAERLLSAAAHSLQVDLAPGDVTAAMAVQEELADRALVKFSAFELAARCHRLRQTKHALEDLFDAIVDPENTN